MARKSQIEKTLKKQTKSHPVVAVLLVLFLGVGAVCGWFTAKQLTKNDKFEIVGAQTITIIIGENYVDEGAVAVAFGKDISSKIKTENNIDNTKEGRYYIRYTVDDFRFHNVVKYRYIVCVQEVSDE